MPGKTAPAEQREETPGVCPPSRGGRPELGGERPPEPGRTGQGGGSGHEGLHCGGTWLPGQTEPRWPGFGYPGSGGEGCGETRPMKQDGAAALPGSPAAEGAALPGRSPASRPVLDTLLAVARRLWGERIPASCLALISRPEKTKIRHLSLVFYSPDGEGECESSTPSPLPTAPHSTLPLPVLFQGRSPPRQGCAAAGPRPLPRAGSIPCLPVHIHAPGATGRGMFGEGSGGWPPGQTAVPVVTPVRGCHSGPGTYLGRVSPPKTAFQSEDQGLGAGQKRSKGRASRSFQTDGATVGCPGSGVSPTLACCRHAPSPGLAYGPARALPGVTLGP